MDLRETYLFMKMRLLSPESSFCYEDVHYKVRIGTSLVAQWLRISLPVQGTWI